MLNLFKKKSKSVEVLAPLTGTTLSIDCHQAYYRYSCSAV